MTNTTHYESVPRDAEAELADGIDWLWQNAVRE